MEMIFGLEDVVGEYLSVAFPELCDLQPYKPHAAVGLVKDGTLVGGLGLRRITRFEGSLSIKCERGCFFTPRMLKFLFTWVFTRTGIVRLTCQVAKGNKRARRLVEGLGFKLEGCKPRGFDGRRPAMIYGMIVEECKWIKDPPNGRS